MLAEGATSVKSEDKQIQPALNDVVNVKGTGKIHKMLHNMLAEGANIEKSEEKQSEPVVEVAKK